jgi:hypothetical protein
LAGCGSTHGGAAARALTPGSSAAQRRLERADLEVVSRGLRGAEPSIMREIEATKTAWPVVAHGLPVLFTPSASTAITAAVASTQQIATPRFISYAGELTGAAAAIAGLLLSYEGLVQRGWAFTLSALRGGSATESATESSLAGASPGGPYAGGASSTAVQRQLASASPAAVRFLRKNSALYIGCVWDGHYNLSTIGDDLSLAYRRLGGGASFGGALRPGEVASVARFYSPANARLTPRPRGS